MQKIFHSKFLLIGILAGFLFGGGWLAWAAIQSEVGLNLFDGATFRRAVSGSVTTLTAVTSQVNPPLSVAPLSTWSITHTPGAATQATATKAASTGVRHVATNITACLAVGGTAQTPIVANLRDGASGAGTVVRSWAFSAPVNGTSVCVTQSDLSIIGTAGVAMTIEFTGAGVAASQETVSMSGYSLK